MATDELTQDEIASARRPRPGGRESRRRGPNVDRETGEILPDEPTLIEVERTIKMIDMRLDELVAEYAILADEEASARADWEEHLDRVIVLVADSGEKSSEDIRRSRAKASTSSGGFRGEDLHRSFLMTKAALDSCGKAMGVYQSRGITQLALLKHLRQVAGFNE